MLEYWKRRIQCSPIEYNVAVCSGVVFRSLNGFKFKKKLKTHASYSNTDRGVYKLDLILHCHVLHGNFIKLIFK